MSLIIPDIERLNPDEEKKITGDILSYGAWALKQGCSVEYVLDPMVGEEITIIHEPEPS